MNVHSHDLDFPLSSAQQEVWLDLGLGHKASIYILGGYLRIDGPIDAAVLRAALDHAIREFDSTRLTLPMPAHA